MEEVDPDNSIFNLVFDDYDETYRAGQHEFTLQIEINGSPDPPEEVPMSLYINALVN